MPTLILLGSVFEHFINQLPHRIEFLLFYQIKLMYKVDEMLEACVQMCLRPMCVVNVCVCERDLSFI